MVARRAALRTALEGGASVGRLVHALYVWIRDGVGVLAEQLRSLAVPLASRPRGISTTSVFPVPLLREKAGSQAKSTGSPFRSPHAPPLFTMNVH